MADWTDLSCRYPQVTGEHSADPTVTPEDLARSAPVSDLWQRVRAVLAGRAAPGAGARRRAAAGRRSGWTPARRSAADEVRVAVERLNLDAASFRQLATKHGGDGDAVRRRGARDRRRPRQDAEPGHRAPAACWSASSTRSARSRRSACSVGRPGRHPGLADADPAADHRRPGRAGTAAPSRCPAEGHAILFGRSIAARLPDDLPASWRWPSWTSAARPP